MKLPLPNFDWTSLSAAEAEVAQGKLQEALLHLKLVKQSEPYQLVTMITCDPIGNATQLVTAKTVHKMRELICEWAWSAAGKRDLRAYIASLNKGVVNERDLHNWQIAIAEEMLKGVKARRGVA